MHSEMWCAVESWWKRPPSLPTTVPKTCVKGLNPSEEKISQLPLATVNWFSQWSPCVDQKNSSCTGTIKPQIAWLPGRSRGDTVASVWTTPTGRPRNKRPIMSIRSACSVPDLLPLTWPAVKLLVLSPPPPSASSHLLHNYSLSDGAIITAAIKSGFRSAPVFLLWLCSICQAAAAAALMRGMWSKWE